jgi:hypothetical protein
MICYWDTLHNKYHVNLFYIYRDNYSQTLTTSAILKPTKYVNKWVRSEGSRLQAGSIMYDLSFQQLLWVHYLLSERLVYLVIRGMVDPFFPPPL